MPVLPKSLMVLGASIQTARTARCLRRPRTALPEQWQAFQTLVAQLALTEVGRSVEIESRTDYAHFRTGVPVRGYEEFAPHIERMKRGAGNVLWPGQCSLYVTSSGTTGHIKSLPVTSAMHRHFREARLASLFFYTARAGHSSIFRGRHLMVGGSTALKRIPSANAFSAKDGNLCGIKASAMPEWTVRYLAEPSQETSELSDWTTKLDTIAAGAGQSDVTLIAGFPNWVLDLAEVMNGSSNGGTQPQRNLQAVWPNLECFMHSGVPVGPFHDELRQAFGPAVKFHEVYSAAEGFIAAQDTEASAGLRLMTGVGLFFEFISLYDFNAYGRLALGEKAVPLEHVRTGIDYVILLTTPAGLCRYVLGDVVRFISTEPPRLVYVGRTELQLNAFGERIMEKELTDILVTVCNRHRWTVKNFHVAPVIINSLTGQSHGRHEWWVELRPGTTETPTGPLLAIELDRELLARNADYQTKRNSGSLDTPLVRLVMPGLFKHWMCSKEKWGDENKMPRCRSDRLIADELMAIACFTD